ncbi:MAG TPA: CpaF family protein [Aquihabitans sp.]|nr:CpaF family protein [Aquihabitans sp.]
MSGAAPDHAGPEHGGPDALDVLVHRRVLAGGAGPPEPEDIAALVREVDPLRPPAHVAATVRRVLARVRGLGPLEALLADPEVTDVLVNGPGPVWVERHGRLTATSTTLDRATIDLLVERIVAPLGRRVDPASPVVDARLADGSRVHVVVPPLAIDGPCLTIRRFSVRRIELAEVAPPPVVALLRWAVRARANVLVSGGTGSGKTTLLNALAASIPAGERIVTVEDAAELRLAADHVVRLETRPSSVEGVAPVSCRDLVRNALRMRPDRLIVGEVRGGEALDMVQAMNTGHDGSLSTLHANGADDALRRLETLVLLAGVGLPLDAVRDHLRSAVDLVVHIARDGTGRRRVTEVAEVLPPGSADPPQRTGGALRPLADARGVLALPSRRVREPSAGPPSAGWCG